MDYAGYKIKWATTKDNGFIKFCKSNTSMEDEVRFNIRTGRQIAVNSSEATVDKNILDQVIAVLKSVMVNGNGMKISILDSAVININNSHINDLKWEPIESIKFNKFVLIPKKKGD